MSTVTNFLYLQVMKDFNMNTPLVMAKTNVPLNELEFGRMMEIELFGHQIDWFASMHRVDKNYVKNVVSAVQNMSLLPNKSTICNSPSQLVLRKAPEMKGMDEDDYDNDYYD